MRHSPSWLLPNTAKSVLSIALLCTGFWGSKIRTDDEPKACFCLGWIVSLTSTWDFSCLKKQQQNQQIGKASSSTALPWSLSSENRRGVPIASSHNVHTSVISAFSFQPLCPPGWSSPPLLPTGFSISNCYLQPLYLWDCWHRRVLLTFQPILMHSFFNKPSPEKSHCAGSLYFTDFSSISLSTLVFQNVSNCHCTYQGIDRYFLPVLPFQHFEMV